MLEAKQDTAASPPRLSFPSDSPTNSSVRRRCSDTDLEEKNTLLPHCILPVYLCVFQLFDITVRVCGICLPGRTGPWSGAQLGVGTEEDSGREDPQLRRFVPGCQPKWRLLSSHRCLASHNLQNAHPFAEVSEDGRRRRRSRVEGEGDGRL